MSCLDMQTKIAMMLDQISVIKRRLKDDSIRPSLRQRLLDDLKILKRDVKELYLDLFRIISN
jgi:hypothetical protein